MLVFYVNPHTLPANATVLEKALFARGAKHARKGKTLAQMREFSDGILNSRGFKAYDAYWTGVDSILEG